MLAIKDEGRVIVLIGTSLRLMNDKGVNTLLE